MTHQSPVDRAQTIRAFLTRHGWGEADRRFLAGDASFRHYERLTDGGRRAVLMDAPPPMEDVRPFIAIARHLEALGFSAPRLLATDEDAGLLLLEDLGDDTFTRLLAQGVEEADLYRLATDQVIALHRLGASAIPAGLAPYDTDRLLAEASLLVDWYAPEMTDLPEGAKADYDARWRRILSAALPVPTTLVLRDFHVDNLLRLEGRSGIRACGLLDFQDALAGPVTYDLMSLLEDARRDVDPALVARMKARYLAAFPNLDGPAFETSWAVMAAIRHAKVIGIFTRLARRDGKPFYLHHIRRVWRLFEAALSHPVLAPMKDWVDRHLPLPCRAIPPAGPTRAMVLAAGLGLRMRPLTLATPKPLLPVGGRTMLDRALDHLADAGVRQTVVNAHWLAGEIHRHLKARSDIEISEEEVLLETGGGVFKALPHLGDKAFFAINGDIVWTDGPRPALARLAAAWNGGGMDALLLLAPVDRAFGYEGPGDFHQDGEGRLRRRAADERCPLVFAGVQILHPRLFEGAPAGAFSLNLLYDRAAAAGRLYGVVHDGGWYHIGTPAALAEADGLLKRPA